MDTQTAIRLVTEWTPEQARASGPLLQSQAEARRLERVLTPATDDEIRSAISFMFNILPMAKQPDAAAMKILQEGYLIALRGQPRWAITEARDAFIGGKVTGYQSSYAPNAADFGREVDRRVDDSRSRLNRALKAVRERLDDPSAGCCRPISPDGRAFINATIERMKAVAEAERIPERKGEDKFAAYRKPKDSYVPSKPLTSEDVAHLPDAPKRGMQKLPVPKFDPLPPSSADGRGAR